MTGTGEVAAIVLAGGSGRRMGAHTNKVFLPLLGRPILAWSIDAFEATPAVGSIVVVVGRDDLERARAAVSDGGWQKVRHVVSGGSTRHQSERNGIEALAGAIDRGGVGYVLFHDAARPFVDPQLVRGLIDALGEAAGAIPAVWPAGPIISCDAGGWLEQYHPGLRAVQTPQAFAARAILEAHRRVEGTGAQATDTASVLESAGGRVAVVEGDPDNIKITLPEDLVRAELIARRFGTPRRGRL